MRSAFLKSRRLAGFAALGALWGLPAIAAAQGGACCLPTGQCVQATQAQCELHNGHWQGAGVPCAPGLCPTPTGACCLMTPSGIICEVLTYPQCRAHNGIFRGPNTDCTTHPCTPPATGACCLPSGHCGMVSEAQCLAAGGIFHAGINCAAANCQSNLGACCLPNGRCVMTTETNCDTVGGTFQGGPCSAANCPQPSGACCIPNPATGGFTCEVLTVAECAAQGGRYRGHGTDCVKNPCPPPRGACCLPSGQCILTTEAMCTSHGGIYHGGPCSSANCPQPSGACCIPDPATGVFTCEVLTFQQCRAQNGHFRGNGTDCTSHPCPPPRGACCFGTTCFMTFEAQCEAHNGAWQGTGVLCSPNPCGRANFEGKIGPEIIADFNADGRVDMNDALAFINAYSAGDADLDGNGATDRDDLMLFINAFVEATR